MKNKDLYTLFLSEIDLIDNAIEKYTYALLFMQERGVFGEYVEFCKKKMEED